MKKQVSGRDCDADMWKDKYLRALADYQNLEKRAGENAEQARKYASGRCIVRLLPVYDALEKLAHHMKDGNASVVLRQMKDALEAEGVVRIETTGQIFDPYCMECIEVAEGEDGIVISELEPGYSLHGKVIRPARVKVGKKQQAGQDGKEGENPG